MIIEKLLLGISLSAPIGPVSLEMIRRGLHSGFFGAFVIRLGGAIGNTLCLLGAYFGLGLINSSPIVMNVLGILGSIVLIYMGSKAFLDKRTHNFNDGSKGASDKSLMNGLTTGFILSIANPIGIVFWLSIFAASLNAEASTASFSGLAQNFLIVVGVLLWGAFLSGCLEVGKRYFTNKMIHMITFCAGILLIGFGLKYGYLALHSLNII